MSFRLDSSRPLMSNIEMRACASPSLNPSSIMPSTIMPPMPVLAKPAPRNSTLWSSFFAGPS
jgi:hypothetical protein